MYGLPHTRQEAPSDEISIFNIERKTRLIFPCQFAVANAKIVEPNHLQICFTLSTRGWSMMINRSYSPICIDPSYSSKMTYLNSFLFDARFVYSSLVNQWGHDLMLWIYACHKKDNMNWQSDIKLPLPFCNVSWPLLWQIMNHFSAKFPNLIFHPLEVMSPYRDQQLKWVKITHICLIWD